jgi:hypothetical protein
MEAYVLKYEFIICGGSECEDEKMKKSNYFCLRFKKVEERKGKVREDV